MASRQMFDIIDKDIKIGYTSCGWKCIQHFKHDKGVAISYDSRKMSKEFSEQTALILNANGIKTSFPKKAIPNQYSIYFDE